MVLNNQYVQSYDFAVSSQPNTLVVDPDYWILKQSQQVASIPDGNVLPVKVKIDKVYPNPFNGWTNIAFTVEGRAQEIELGI